MAKDAERQNTAEAPRVRKASEVHKRRPEGRASDALPDRADARAIPDEAKKAPSAPSAGSSGTGKVSLRTGAPKGEDSPSPHDASTREKPKGEAGPEEARAPEGTGEDANVSAGAWEGSAEDHTGYEEDEGVAEKRMGRRRRRAAIALVGIFAAALLVFVGFMAGSRWVRFNDDADMQGKWFVYGTDVPISFTKDAILINDETAYAYRIDPVAKTMEYSFGNLAGQGRYWFNDRRDTLVITDGADYTMWSTLVDDITFDMGSLFSEEEFPAEEASIVLTRSVVQAPPAPAATDAAADDTEPAPPEEADGSSSAESSDMLMVSDIMMEEEELYPDEQGG